jgi:SAM-dependent methyltransferase
MEPLSSTPLHPQWLVARVARRKTSWIATEAAGHVLDVGCSDRSTRLALLNADSYVGLDYPATAIHLYGTRPDVYGSASRLPFADATFDCVLLLDVLEHLAEPEQALREALRVLRPGGHTLLTVPFAYPLHDQPHDYQRFTEYGLAHRLSRCGFVRVKMQEVGASIETAALGLALCLSQASIEAIHARGWRALFAPLGLLLVPLVNVMGWLLSRLLPARRFMPVAYHVQASRPEQAQ